MGYLLPTEYVQYGLTAETTDDWGDDGLYADGGLLPAAEFAGDTVCGADAADEWSADGSAELSSAGSVSGSAFCTG